MEHESLKPSRKTAFTFKGRAGIALAFNSRRRMQSILLEARAGIEPAHNGFADRCVTTSPSGLRYEIYQIKTNGGREAAVSCLCKSNIFVFAAFLFCRLEVLTRVAIAQAEFGGSHEHSVERGAELEQTLDCMQKPYFRHSIKFKDNKYPR